MSVLGIDFGIDATPLTPPIDTPTTIEVGVSSPQVVDTDSITFEQSRNQVSRSTCMGITYWIIVSFLSSTVCPYMTQCYCCVTIRIDSCMYITCTICVAIKAFMVHQLLYTVYMYMYM